jgi:hypothetical protein
VMASALIAGKVSRKTFGRLLMEVQTAIRLQKLLDRVRRLGVLPLKSEKNIQVTVAAAQASSADPSSSNRETAHGWPGHQPCGSRRRGRCRQTIERPARIRHWTRHSLHQPTRKRGLVPLPNAPPGHGIERIFEAQNAQAKERSLAPRFPPSAMELLPCRVSGLRKRGCEH